MPKCANSFPLPPTYKHTQRQIDTLTHRHTNSRTLRIYELALFDCAQALSVYRCTLFVLQLQIKCANGDSKKPQQDNIKYVLVGSSVRAALGAVFDINTASNIYNTVAVSNEDCRK